MILDELYESAQTCPECGGPAFSNLILAEKKDACYNKVRSRYKVWPSAYASGALVQCRKKGAANWGNKSESIEEDQLEEITRRDLLKGAGAAAVAGAAGGAKSQVGGGENESQWAANRAASVWTNLARDNRSVTKWIYDTLQRRTMQFYQLSGGRDFQKSTEIALQDAYSAVEKSFQGLYRRIEKDKEEGSIAKAFLKGYISPELSRDEQWKITGSMNRVDLAPTAEQFVQAYTNSLNRTLQSTQQSTQQQQPTNTNKLSANERSVLTRALYVYYFTKPEDSEIFKLVSKEIGNFITARNAKSTVNDFYKQVVDLIEKTKESDPKKYEGFSQWVRANHQQAINDLRNLTAEQSKDEFKESSEQTIEEDQLDEKCWDTHRQAGMKKKGDRMVPNCVPREGVEESEREFRGANGPVSVTTTPGRTVVKRKEWDDPKTGSLGNDGKFHDPDFAYFKSARKSDYDSGDYSDDRGLGEGDKIGNMDADRFDDAMARLKKLAGQGPLKTVWDPQKRVYRNVPVAVQPKQQPSK